MDVRRLLGWWAAVVMSAGTIVAIGQTATTPEDLSVAATAPGAGSEAPPPAPVDTVASAPPSTSTPPSRSTPPSTTAVPSTLPASTTTTSAMEPSPSSSVDDRESDGMPSAWKDKCVPGSWSNTTGSCRWKPAVLEGTVRYADGRPAPGVCIGPGITEPWARSDGEGRWYAVIESVDVLPAQITDCGSGDPLGIATQLGLEIDFTPGETTQLDVVVTRLAGIRGVVLDADGRPVPDACVRSGGRQDLPPVRTEDDGSFVMTRVVPGTAQVEVGECPEDLDEDGFGRIGHFDPPLVTTTAGRWSSVQLEVVIGTGPDGVVGPVQGP